MGEAVATVLLLLAAVNPPRLRGTSPGAGGGEPGAAVGGAAAGTALLLLVLGADVLLDAARIGTGTAMLAAGLVAVVTGLHDLVRDPEPVAAPEGWQAGLAPVAFPLVLRPAPVLCALALGAARGSPVAVAAVAAAAGVLGAAATGWADREGWASAGRLTAALLVLLGVDLAIDGALLV